MVLEQRVASGNGWIRASSGNRIIWKSIAPPPHPLSIPPLVCTTAARAELSRNWCVLSCKGRLNSAL
jgi:hypothetical protein